MEESEKTLARLAGSAKHYHRRASWCRAFAFSLKALQIVLAASIPILALVDPAASRPAVNGVLGALIVAIEGFQRTFQFEHYWISYRTCAVELQREESLFLGQAAHYANAVDRSKLLTERLEQILSENYASKGMRRYLAN